MTLKRNAQISSKSRQEEDKYNKILLSIFSGIFLAVISSNWLYTCYLGIGFIYANNILNG